MRTAAGGRLVWVWRARRWFRRLRRHPRECLAAAWIQNAWLLKRIPASHIGSGTGLLTQLRLRRHRRLARPIQIAIFDDEKTGSGFGRLTAYWINERSRQCSATINTGFARADIIWLQTQDPLGEQVRRRFLDLTALAHRARILNLPENYNAYHAPDAFARLQQAGVRVPRQTFGASDMGLTNVVYKRVGMQAAEKTLRTYAGEWPGYRAFAFVDSRGAGGLHTRYRAFYVAGAVRPSKAMRCRHWNVCLKNRPLLEYAFSFQHDEADQIKRIADTFGLDYFAVDFLRPGGDGRAVFVDINVYPTIESLPATGRALGYRGRWHTFDTRARLGIAEPDGRPFHEVFDEAIAAFLQVAKSGVPQVPR